MCYDGEFLWAGTEYDMIYPKLTRIVLEDGIVQEAKKYRPKKIRPDFGMDFVAVADGGDSLWGSYQGIWRFDKKQETFSRVEAKPAWMPDANSQQISSIGVRQLRVESDTLWIVTGRILKHKLESSTYEIAFEADPLGKGPFGFEYTGKSFVLLDRNQPATAKGAGGCCYAILVDGQRLWCSPAAGVYHAREFTLGISRYDRANGKWKTWPSREVGLPRHGPGFICTDIAKVGPEIWFCYKATDSPYKGKGLVVAHNPSTGKWRQPVRGRNVYSIAVSDEYVYLGVDGGAVRMRRPVK